MAKPYNHRRAENEYKKWKEKDELFMENNGMPMDKILLMRDFDRVQFNSDRRFFEKVDYDSEQKLSKAIQPDLPKLNDPQTIVACLSSKVNSKHHLPTHYLLPEGLGLKYKSMVMCEQIRVLDKSRLIKKITKLDKRHMMHIDRRIKISLDLKQQHLHSRK